MNKHIHSIYNFYSFCNKKRTSLTCYAYNRSLIINNFAGESLETFSDPNFKSAARFYFPKRGVLENSDCIKNRKLIPEAYEIVKKDASCAFLGLSNALGYKGYNLNFKCKKVHLYLHTEKDKLYKPFYSILFLLSTNEAEKPEFKKGSLMLPIQLQAFKDQVTIIDVNTNETHQSANNWDKSHIGQGPTVEYSDRDAFDLIGFDLDTLSKEKIETTSLQKLNEAFQKNKKFEIDDKLAIIKRLSGKEYLELDEKELETIESIVGAEFIQEVKESFDESNPPGDQPEEPEEPAKLRKRGGKNN